MALCYQICVLVLITMAKVTSFVLFSSASSNSFRPWKARFSIHYLSLDDAQRLPASSCHCYMHQHVKEKNGSPHIEMILYLF